MVVRSEFAYAQQEVNAAAIANISIGGIGYVTYSTNANGINAQIGRWDTPYPGEYDPTLEPVGYSYLNIDVDVNDGGLVSFNYRLQTYDAGIWDWFDIYLITDAEERILVSHLGKPGETYGSYWGSPLVTLTQGLNNWRHQQVRFVFLVHQDGWGDQTVGNLVSFNVRSCDVPPLTLVTDPEAVAFERGNNINTERLVANMQTALTCFQGAVVNAGGTFTLTSAYRPVTYQQHLQEVWDRWSDLRDKREAECQELREEVRIEFEEHHHLLLGQRPVTNSSHTRGEAIDAAINLPAGTSVNVLANECELTRPVPQRDPVHFVHQ
jgi:hypothetical protein